MGVKVPFVPLAGLSTRAAYVPGRHCGKMLLFFCGFSLGSAQTAKVADLAKCFLAPARWAGLCLTDGVCGLGGTEICDTDLNCTL